MSRRGSAFGRQEFLSSPIARVMAGVGGTLGGGVTTAVNRGRAQDEQRRREDREIDIKLAETGGTSAEERQRQAQLESVEAMYGEDLDAAAEQAGQTLQTRQAARDPFEDAIDFVVQQKDGYHGPLPAQQRPPSARALPEENLTPLQTLELQRNEAGFDNLHDYAVQTQYEDDIDAVTKEIGDLYSKDYGVQSRVPGLPASRQRKADEARLAELNERLESRVGVHDTLANQGIYTDEDLDGAIAEAGFDVAMLDQRDRLRTPHTPLEQIGQNLRGGGTEDLADARKRLAASEFYGLRDHVDDASFDVLRERFPDEALTTVDGINQALSFTKALLDRDKRAFDETKEIQKEGMKLRKEWSSIADQRQRQWELTRRASEAYPTARRTPSETDDEQKQVVRLAQGEMLAAAADIAGINAGGNIEDIQSRADAGSGPIAAIANIILAYREGHTLKPKAVDDLARMIRSHGQLAFENWHNEFDAYKRTAAEDDYTIDRWAPANTHPTPRGEAEDVWKALTNFEEF